MKSFLFPLTLMMLLLIACQPTEGPQEDTTQAPAELIINLTSDPTVNAHSATMGLHFGQNALDSDIDLTVFLNVDGVKLMQPQADTIAFEGENLQQLLKDIQASGGTIVACPHCMEVHGVQAADLLEGVQMGKSEIMMERLKKNPTVFTY